MDLNHRPPGPEPGALARLRYAPTVTLGCIVATQAGLSDYHSSALPGYRRVAVHFSSNPSPHSSRNLLLFSGPQECLRLFHKTAGAKKPPGSVSPGGHWKVSVNKRAAFTLKNS